MAEAGLLYADAAENSHGVQEEPLRGPSSRSHTAEGRHAVFTLALAMAALCPGCSTQPGRRAAPPQPNVILITIDTLRADRLGCYGNRSIDTPAMDSLARDGVVFRRAIAQVPLTVPSHAAILTGTYPVWNGVRDWSDANLSSTVPTLAEIFKSQGYTTAAFVSAFVLDSMWGLGRGFELYDDGFKAEEYKSMRHFGLERRADETVQRAIAWLEARPSAPFFLWLHLYDPHAPYRPPEPFKSHYAERPYDGEVAYTDQQLGRFFAFLKSKGLYSTSLILLASDHGEALGDHQEQQHGFFIYNSTVHVPLVVRFPDGFVPAQRDIPGVVNLVDIAPTLTQFCGFPSSQLSSFQGKSLLPLIQKSSSTTPRSGYSESLYPRNSFGWHSLYGLETESYHYIEAPREELYDLRMDPGESRNIIRREPALAAALRENLRDMRSRFQRPQEAAAGSEKLDRETVEKLRSLGYVTVSSTKLPRGDDSSAPDPKDQIGFYNQIMRATELAENGRLRESNARLASLAAKHPRAYLLPFLQGENFLAQGKPRKAIPQYRRALELNPTSDQSAVGLGRAAYQAEENDEAAKAYELALHLNSHNFLARLALARDYWRLKRFEAAAEQELDVLRSHPNFAQAHADYGVTLVHLRRFDEAAAAILKGIELGYREAMTYNFLGNAYRALGRPSEAVRAYEQAIDLDPKYPTAYVNLALIYSESGRRDKALEYYRQACRLNAEVCRQVASKFQ